MSPRRPRIRSVHVTDTEFRVEGNDYFDGSDAFVAMMAWFAEHDIDPWTIPADSLLVRDPKAKTVAFDQVLKNEDGTERYAADFKPITKRVVVELEMPPAPWPAEVFAFAKAAKP